jgi:hypothetical protein
MSLPLNFFSICTSAHDKFLLGPILSVMKLSLLLLTVGASCFVNSIPWNGPHPTSVQRANKSVGFSPKPTNQALFAGDSVSNILKRQMNRDTCGYYNGILLSSFVHLVYSLTDTIKISLSLVCQQVKSAPQIPAIKLLGVVSQQRWTLVFLLGHASTVPRLQGIAMRLAWQIRMC